MKRHDDHAELDALLQSESQQMVQRAVGSLPEESLSLAWRSDLNERLRQVRPVSKWRAKFAVAWRPAFALALASCLAVILMVQQTPTNSHTGGTLEDSLVATYRETADADELAGAGLLLHEVNDTTQVSETSGDSSEAEISSL